MLTIKVPTESDTASTTGLTVQLPMDTPIASVSVQPHPGWTFTTTTSKLPTPITTDDGELTEAVSSIVWKADSAASAIKPGEFDQFNISAGPLPKVDALTLKAIQTYSDGTVVKWIEQAAPGSSTEPEHPAPTLKLTSISDVSTPTGTPTTSTQSMLMAASDGDRASKGSATTGIVLGGIGVVLGAAALALALLRRRPASTQV